MTGPLFSDREAERVWEVAKELEAETLALFFAGKIDRQVKGMRERRTLLLESISRLLREPSL